MYFILNRPVTFPKVRPHRRTPYPFYCTARKLLSPRFFAELPLGRLGFRRIALVSSRPGRRFPFIQFNGRFSVHGSPPDSFRFSAVFPDVLFLSSAAPPQIVDHVAVVIPSPEVLAFWFFGESHIADLVHPLGPWSV